MACCKCNKTGHSKCTDCLPSSLGNCSNASTAIAISQVCHTNTFSCAASVSTLETVPTNNNSDSSDLMPTLLNNNNSNSSVPLLTVLTSTTINSSDSSVSLPIQPTSNVSDSLARLITVEINTPVSQSSSCVPGEGPVRELPSFHPVAKPTFVWGKCTSGEFTHLLDEAYSEIVHWRPNFFSLPLGKAGKAFVLELTRLCKAFATNFALECVTMKAAIVLPILAYRNHLVPQRTKHM